jgi:F420-dependent oxidoreductase-like protein
VVQAIREAEMRGVPAAWLTMGGNNPDIGTILAAAAAVTHTIKLGTSIIPTWPRHPVAIAQQAVALDALAPGRFRLGIGPSHAASMEPIFGVEWKAPLGHLREYLIVLKALLQQGEVDFAGKHVKTKARIAAPVDVPVMASALRAASFRLCGEISDGAISWVSPWPYLREAALPALRQAAEAAGRAPPPLIVHLPVVLSEDREAVRRAAGSFLNRYVTLPNYQGMFAAAGFPDAAGADREAAVDALAVSGSESAISERLRTVLREGAAEIIAHPIFATEDRDLTPFLELIARANR